MTVAIFLGSLLIAMALGIPIAFSLLLSAALMWHLDLFDAQILGGRTSSTADGSRCWPCHRSSCWRAG